MEGLKIYRRGDRIEWCRAYRIYKRCDSTVQDNGGIRSIGCVNAGWWVQEVYDL